MKIVCIGRNYREHAKELGNEVPGEPVIFLKPASALVPAGGPIRLPSFSQDVHHEIELVYLIARRHGKAMAERVTIGLDLTARDLQQQLKQQGLPWEKAKSFDGSAYVAGTFAEVVNLPEGRHIDFTLARNGMVVQKGNSGEMIFSVEDLIDHVERYMRLETGDLLFTGTPAGVGRLSAGDVLNGTLLGEPLFELRVE